MIVDRVNQFQIMFELKNGKSLPEKWSQYFEIEKTSMGKQVSNVSKEAQQNTSEYKEATESSGNFFEVEVKVLQAKRLKICAWYRENL